MAERTRRAYGIDAGQLALWCSKARPRPRRRDPARAAALRRRCSPSAAPARPPRPASWRRCASSTASCSSTARSPRTRPTSSPRRSAPSKLPRVLAPAQISALLDRIPATTPLELRDRALFEIAYACGLRAEELVDLDVASISFEDEEVRVEGKGRKTRHRPGRRGGAARRRALARARPSGAAERRRRPGAVPLQERPPAVHVGRPAAPAVMGATGCDPGRDLAARAASLVRDAPPGRGRRPAGDPGAAGPQLREHDADLHSGRVCAPEVRLHPSASPRLKRFDAGEGSLWTRTSRPSSSRICGGATRPLGIRLPVSASSSRIRRS